MTGTRGQTSGTVMGDSATIDGGISPPTVTSGTGESPPSSLPAPSPSSPPSDDDGEKSSLLPLPLENARTCLTESRDECVISDVTHCVIGDVAGQPRHSVGGTWNRDHRGNVHIGLVDSRLVGRDLDRREGTPDRRTDVADEPIKRPDALKLAFNLKPSILHVVCKTRHGSLKVELKRCTHVICSFMHVAIIIVLIVATT